jgi:hypothetical protein
MPHGRIDILTRRRFDFNCGRLKSTAKDANPPGFAFSTAGFFIASLIPP